MSDKRPSVTRVVKYIRKGVGISYTNVEYADSTSNSVAPTSGWKTTAPAWQNGHYIWQRVHIVYTDGTDGYSNPVCLSGGKGISKIEEYYLATSSASGVTTSTSGWTKAIQSVTAEKKYLWNYEVVTYTDGTNTVTTPVIIGTYGDKGVGISSITEHYLATSAASGVTRSTTGWTTSIQTVTNTKKYLWNYETVTYTDGSTADTDPVIIGVYGDTGVGISSVTEYYLATSAASGVTTSTSGWTTSIQTVTATKKYLWNYEVIAYSNGTTSTTTPVIIGTYGDKGVGISSITEHYLATSAASGVTRSTTGWTTSIQTVTNTKKYLWNYETVTYTDGSTADTDPVIIGVYGDEGPEGPEGPQGPQGTNAPYVELSRTSILYQANNDGYSTAAQNFEINCYLKVSGNTCTISSTGNISITSITGVEVTKNSVSKITVKIPHSKIIAGVIIVQMTGTYGGKSYTAKVSITVEPNREGAQGPQGEEGPQGPQGPQGGTGSTGPRGYRGPGLRGPQDWALMDIDYQFYKGDESTQEPYEDFVVYNGNYYKCVKSHTKTSYNYPGSAADTSNGYWQLSDKLAMVAANVLFAKHGYFGSAIISGDWMISTNGTIDGTAYNNGAKYQGIIAYSLFNPDNPLGNPIAKHNSTSTVSFAASETTKTINTVSLESGKIYYIEATGRAGSASGAFYVRLRNASTGATHTPIMINGTSNVTRAGYVNITATGSYYLEVYNSGGISGIITESKVMEKNFAPVYALDLLTGKSYQSDAYIKGNFISENKTQGNAISINTQNGDFTMTGPVTVNDDDRLPSSSARAELAKILFATDPDSLTRLAYMWLKDGHGKHVVNADPFFGVSVTDTVLSDERGAGFDANSFGISQGKDSNYRALYIDIYGVSLQTGAGSSATFKSKTWEQLLG